MEVSDQADQKAVTVGALEDDTSGGTDKTDTSKTDDSTTDKTQTTDSGNGTKRTISYVLGGVGVAGIGLASFFGIDAISKSSQAKGQCSTPPSNCMGGAEDTMSSAKTSALLSDIGFGIGIAGPRGGGVPFFTSNSGGQSSTPPSSDPASSSSASKNVFRVTPLVGPQGGGAALVGTF